MEFIHKPVMTEEVLTWLDPQPGGRYVDCTSGGGGHTRALLDRVGPQGAILGLDQDPEAIGHLERTLGVDSSNLTLRQTNFSNLGQVLAEIGWETVDGMLLDLGISSFQLEGSGRGFSFDRDEPLDMRMDPDVGQPAGELVNRLPEKELADLIYRYGEERASRRVARSIVYTRRRRPIETAGELAEVVRKALWRPGRRPRLDSATRTFQALRLAVNKELDHLESFLALAPELLRLGGRFVAISFHSLEDRLVKRAMIPPRGPDQGPDGAPALKALFKKPLQPTPEEVAANPRSRSAKLRAGVRI